MPTTEEPLWESTTVQNLIRYRPSGTYFARFKVGGKLVRQSLETAVFSVAKQSDDVMRSDGRSRFLPLNCRSPVSTSAEAVFRKSRRAFSIAGCASPNAQEHDQRAIWLQAKRIDGSGMMRVRHKLARGGD